MDLRFDLGPVLALAGAGGTGGKADVVVRGKDLFVKPPQVDGFALPQGADWVRLDLARTLAATGVDAKGLADVMTLDPGAQIDVLKAAEGVEDLGSATVDGAETTHYKGRLSLSDYAESLPPERRERAEKAIEAFTAETGGEQAQPFEVWIDREDRIRRMVQTAKVPGQQGVPAGEVGITMELSGFGTEVEAQAPPKADTFDATVTVTDALAASQ